MTTGYELFRTPDEVRAIVLSNAELMMRDRRFHSTWSQSEGTYLRGSGWKRSLATSAAQVLVLMEWSAACDKKELAEYAEELSALFRRQPQVCYRYCVYIHRQQSLTLCQRHSLQHMIESALPPDTPHPPFQYFAYSFFYISIPRHELQPRFQRLSIFQLQQFKSASSSSPPPSVSSPSSSSPISAPAPPPLPPSSHPVQLDKHKLPRLSWTDPIRRYYNYPEGAVILITRDGESTVQELAYRIVTKDVM